MPLAKALLNIYRAVNDKEAGHLGNSSGRAFVKESKLETVHPKKNKQTNKQYKTKNPFMTRSSMKSKHKNYQVGTSHVVQWLRLWAANEGEVGSVPSGGIKIPHATRHSLKIKTKNYQASSK